MKLSLRITVISNYNNRILRAFRICYANCDDDNSWQKFSVNVKNSLVVKFDNNSWQEYFRYLFGIVILMMVIIIFDWNCINGTMTHTPHIVGFSGHIYIYIVSAWDWPRGSIIALLWTRCARESEVRVSSCVYMCTREGRYQFFNAHIGNHTSCTLNACFARVIARLLQQRWGLFTTCWKRHQKSKPCGGSTGLLRVGTGNLSRATLTFSLSLSFFLTLSFCIFLSFSFVFLLSLSLVLSLFLFPSLSSHHS